MSIQPDILVSAELLELVAALNSHKGAYFVDAAASPDGQLVLSFRRPGRHARRHVLVRSSSYGLAGGPILEGCEILATIAAHPVAPLAVFPTEPPPLRPRSGRRANGPTTGDAA